MDGTLRGWEGQHKATSVFGRVCTFRNPSNDLRAKHDEVDWDSYPPAPEDGGPVFVRVSIRAFSDTSTQSASHTAVTREALDCMLHRDVPFLDSLDSPGVVVQSDGASNFTCKDAVPANYLNRRVVCVLISVEGMGKDAVDRDNAVCQSAFSSTVRNGVILTDAQSRVDVLNQSEKLKVGGRNLNVDPGREPAPTSRVDKAPKQFPIWPCHKLCTFDRDRHTMTLYEQFDAARSAELGRPVGYGEGKVVDVSELGISR